MFLQLKNTTVVLQLFSLLPMKFGWIKTFRYTPIFKIHLNEYKLNHFRINPAKYLIKVNYAILIFTCVLLNLADGWKASLKFFLHFFFPSSRLGDLDSSPWLEDRRSPSSIRYFKPGVSAGVPARRLGEWKLSRVEGEGV